MSRLVFTLFIFFYFSSELLACRIWAVISKSNLSLNMTSQQEFDLVSSQLDALFDQSQYNQNGWAVIRYGMNQDSIDDTVFRSELPANQDSLNYWSTMNAIFNQQSDNIAIAHIRAATSGASSIPNPHPWIFESDKTYSFVHNGGASKELLYDLITNNGLDESWLEQHPPQTFGNGDWRDNGWSSVVDSELIMLLIMKQIDIFYDVLTGLESAISLMIEAGINPYMLNLVFSDSESLYVYGGSSGLKFIESGSFYSVMSSPPTNSSSDSWDPITNGELVVLKKDGILAVVTFHSLEDKIVKYFFKSLSENKSVSRYIPKREEKINLFKSINKKPISPSEKEIKENPPSRSAKLRYVIKKEDFYDFETDILEKFEHLIKIENFSKKL